jgi:hypothetical protein
MFLNIDGFYGLIKIKFFHVLANFFQIIAEYNDVHKKIITTCNTTVIAFHYFLDSQYLI